MESPHNSHKYLFILTHESFLQKYLFIYLFIYSHHTMEVSGNQIILTFLTTRTFFKIYFLVYFTRKKVSQVWNHSKVNKLW